jgi:hypothetical protein
VRRNSAAGNGENLILPLNGKIAKLNTLENRVQPVKSCPEVAGRRGRGAERRRFVAFNFGRFSYPPSAFVTIHAANQAWRH